MMLMFYGFSIISLLYAENSKITEKKNNLKIAIFFSSKSINL